MRNLVKTEAELTTFQSDTVVNKFEGSIKFYKKIPLKLYDILLSDGTVVGFDTYITNRPEGGIGICIGKHPENGKDLFIALQGLVCENDTNPSLRCAFSSEYPISSVDVTQFGYPKKASSASPVHTLNGYQRTYEILTPIKEANKLSNFKAYDTIENYFNAYYNQRGQWYIPDLGELDLVFSIYEELNSKLAVISSNLRICDSFWSSRLKDSNSVWTSILSTASNMALSLGSDWPLAVPNETAAVLPFIAL